MYKDIVEWLPEVIYTANAKNLHIQYVNKAVSHVYGYTDADWMSKGTLWLDTIHPYDRQEVLRALKNLSVGQSLSLEYRITNKDNEVRWVQDRVQHMSNPELLCGVLIDITELKKQLTYVEQNLDEILEESATVVYRCEPAQHFSSTFISNNVRRLTGYAPRQFTDDPTFWGQHIHPEDRDRVYEEMRRLYDNGSLGHEYRFLHSDGTYHWIHDELRLIRNHVGDAVDIIGNWVNIDERKQLETDKAKLERKIHHAQKMQAIGTLAGGIAHEFNNMLGIVIGNTDLIINCTHPDERMKKHLGQVLAAANRSRDLVQQLLSFSRTNSRKEELTELEGQVRKELEFIRSTLSSAIDLQVDSCKEPLFVRIDHGELKQILINLISNAAYAMKQRGKVSIHCEKVQVQQGQAGMPLNLASGSYARLSVSDTGSGISEEAKQRIFEPFFTTKNVGDGTGLGLSVVYGMVEDYGGNIQVESVVGQGATFHLYFPIVLEQTTVSGQSQDVLHNTDCPAIKRILFVDDEPMYGQLAQAMLSGAGFDVTALTDSREALERFKQNPAQFDLLIVDQIMPGMFGTQLSREILSLRPDIPIVLCSGYDEKTGCSLVGKFGIRRFLMKPFTVKELITAVEASVAARWQSGAA